MKHINIILISILFFLVINSCDWSYDSSECELSMWAEADYCYCIDEPDSCFQEFQYSYNYAIWNIQLKEWQPMLDNQEPRKIRFWMGEKVYSNNINFRSLKSRIWDLENGIESNLGITEISSNNCINGFFFKRLLFSNDFRLDDGFNSQLIDFNSSTLTNYVSNNEELYLQLNDSENLSQILTNPVQLVTSSIDTNMITGEGLVKLVGRYALFCDKQSYILLRNIDTGEEIEFSITVNQNSDPEFEEKFAYSLDNAEIEDGVLYLSSIYIDQIDGLNTGQSSLIAITGTNVELLPLPAFTQEAYAIQNGSIFIELDFTRPFSETNDFINRMYEYDIETGDITNMNGGLCCACATGPADIFSIAATNTHVAVIGKMCKAGMEENRKIN